MADGGDDRFIARIGGTGVPFLTRSKDVPLYKRNDPLYKRPQHVKRIRNEIYDLSDEDDLERYNKIWEAVGLGSVTVVEEDRQWDAHRNTWKVFIRWYLAGQMDPSERRNEINRSIQGLPV
jgi:hypothetical protein